MVSSVTTNHHFTLAIFSGSSQWASLSRLNSQSNLQSVQLLNLFTSHNLGIRTFLVPICRNSVQGRTCPSRANPNPSNDDGDYYSFTIIHRIQDLNHLHIYGCTLTRKLLLDSVPLNFLCFVVVFVCLLAWLRHLPRLTRSSLSAACAHFRFLYVI